jgi:hypothetical protein
MQRVAIQSELAEFSKQNWLGITVERVSEVDGKTG